MSSATSATAALLGWAVVFHENSIETRKVFSISLSNFQQANERGSSLTGKRAHCRALEHVLVQRTQGIVVVVRSKAQGTVATGTNGSIKIRCLPYTLFDR